MKKIYINIICRIRRACLSIIVIDIYFLKVGGLIFNTHCTWKKNIILNIMIVILLLFFTYLKIKMKKKKRKKI